MKFGFAPVKEIRLPPNEYSSVIGGIRSKIHIYKEDRSYGVYKTTTMSYFFYLKKDSNDIIIYRKEKE